MAKTKRIKGSLGEPIEPLEPLEIRPVSDVFNEHRSREKAKEIAAAESELSNALLKAWEKDEWPLSVAVCWIATLGDVSKLNHHNALEDSASALRRAIKAPKPARVDVKGVKAGGDGFPKKVPAKCFSDAAPFLADAPDELMFNDNDNPPPYLEWLSLAETHPELGDGDCIVARWKTIWKRLTIKRADILALWPSDKVSIYHTGSPGRPSAIQFIVREWHRRRDAGEALQQLAAEARALNAWCAKEHSGIAATTPRAIENKIRPEYNAWKFSLI